MQLKKICFVCVLLTLLAKVTVSEAHNPLSAKYYLEVKEGGGILSIYLSQAGLHEALKKAYPKIDVQQLTAIKYKKLAIKYLKKNFDLKINNQNIRLLGGGIKLGNHQTDVKFITEPFPKTLENLYIQINAFKENTGHQTVFVISFNKRTEKIILGERNNYTADYRIANNQFIPNKKGNSQTIWLIIIAGVVLLLASVTLLLLRRRRR